MKAKINNKFILIFILIICLAIVYFIFVDDIIDVQNKNIPKGNNVVSNNTANIQSPDLKVEGAPTPKEYINEELKISFTYPENFYINQELLDSNHSILISPVTSDGLSRNPESNILSSLKIQKISRGDELNELLNNFQEKSKDKELYPDYKKTNTEINGKNATIIENTDVFSGGIINSIIVYADDFVILLSYFEDTPFTNIFREIIDKIIFI